MAREHLDAVAALLRRATSLAANEALRAEVRTFWSGYAKGLQNGTGGKLAAKDAAASTGSQP